VTPQVAVASETGPGMSGPYRGKRRLIRRLRGWLIFVVILAAVGAASAGIYRYRQAAGVVDLPVAPARKGEFLVIIDNEKTRM